MTKASLTHRVSAVSDAGLAAITSALRGVCAGDVASALTRRVVVRMFVTVYRQGRPCDRLEMLNGLIRQVGKGGGLH